MNTTNEFSTAPFSPPPSTPKSSSKEIPKFVFSSFQRELTIQKLLELQTKLKQNEKHGKISLSKFIPIMIEVFGHEKSKYYIRLYNQIFTRFQTKKCAIIHKQSKFYLTSLNSSNLSTYELISALTMFLKIDYKSRLKILFELTDLDEDGYINENEIKRLISVINIIFADQQSPIKSSSSIINQSLINIHNEQILHSLFYRYGKIQEILDNEKVISFNDFYNGIIKIPHYKYKVLPCYSTLTDCLNTPKREDEISVRRENKIDFIRISNQLMTTVNECLSPVKSKLNINSLLSHAKSYSHLTTNNMSTISSNGNSKSQGGRRKRRSSIGMTSVKDTVDSVCDVDTSEKVYKVEMNDIRNLEVQPVIVKFTNTRNLSKVMSSPKFSDLISQKLNRRKSILSNGITLTKGGGKKKRLGSIFKSRSGSCGTYMTYDEVMKEINLLSEAGKKENIRSFQLNLIENQCNRIAYTMRNKLSDRSENPGYLTHNRFKVQPYTCKH